MKNKVKRYGFFHVFIHEKSGIVIREIGVSFFPSFKWINRIQYGKGEITNCKCERRKKLVDYEY